MVQSPPSRHPRQVVLVVFDGVQALDVTGPAEVLHSAGRLGGSSSSGPSLSAALRLPTASGWPAWAVGR